jgi:hypothetical protein
LFCPLTFCNSGKNKNICSYKIDTLFKNYDSSKFIIKRYDNLVEVLDSVPQAEEKGIYKFDKNGVLRFYAYLLNENNDYYFGIEYDSLGREINKPKSTVVRCLVSKFGSDSLKLSFLLYKINNSYGDIQLEGSNFLKKVSLFESKHLSNLIGADLIIPIPPNKTVYITGAMRNNCLFEATNFKDSVILPKELLISNSPQVRR